MIVIALVAFFLGLSFGLGNLNIPLVGDLVSHVSTIVPIHKYDINTNCELYYFILKRPITDVLPTSQQELEIKYPTEYEKIMKTTQTSEYTEYISTHNNTKMPMEMKEALASIIIKSSSINPNLEQNLIKATGLESNDALYTEIEKEDPDCAKEIEVKLAPQKIPIIVRISSITKGSGAEKAGLLKGDIITAIDGTNISSSDLSKLNLKANQTVIVSIIRDGKDIQIPVVLTPSKDDPQKGLLGIMSTYVANNTQSSISSPVFLHYKSELDSVKKRHSLIIVDMESNLKALLEKNMSPDEFISKAQISSSQTTSLVSEMIESNPPAEWKQIYGAYFKFLKKYNDYLDETISLANKIKSGASPENLSDEISKIDSIKKEFQSSTLNSTK